MKWAAVKPAPKVFQSAEEFEEWYASTHDTQVAILHLDGIYAIPCCRARCIDSTAPCGCGTGGCRGYLLLHGVTKIAVSELNMDLLVRRSDYAHARSTGDKRWLLWEASEVIPFT